MKLVRDGAIGCFCAAWIALDLVGRYDTAVSVPNKVMSLALWVNAHTSPLVQLIPWLALLLLAGLFLRRVATRWRKSCEGPEPTASGSLPVSPEEAISGIGESRPEPKRSPDLSATAPRPMVHVQDAGSGAWVTKLTATGGVPSGIAHVSGGATFVMDQAHFTVVGEFVDFPPSNRFQESSDADLIEWAGGLASDIDHFYTRSVAVHGRIDYRAVEPEFDLEFGGRLRAITGALGARVKPVRRSELSIECRLGLVALDGRLSGHDPVRGAAELLRFLAKRLQT